MLRPGPRSRSAQRSRSGTAPQPHRSAQRQWYGTAQRRRAAEPYGTAQPHRAGSESRTESRRRTGPGALTVPALRNLRPAYRAKSHPPPCTPCRVALSSTRYDFCHPGPDHV
ncbi:hypothetical protein GCM10014719_20560 [Planomonospora parontospora subsp. antibiotica]|nr:hypothetical protein GCM10014719_20560 [Planomonospora parontospora subsp. antibiotica]GII15568.1 hypothetical protein Ppa05_22940 [Planomonospora parontospora subsp. antibiotica]